MPVVHRETFPVHNIRDRMREYPQLTAPQPPNYISNTRLSMVLILLASTLMLLELMEMTLISSGVDVANQIGIGIWMGILLASVASLAFVIGRKPTHQTPSKTFGIFLVLSSLAGIFSFAITVMSSIAFAVSDYSNCSSSEGCDATFVTLRSLSLIVSAVLAFLFAFHRETILETLATEEYFFEMEMLAIENPTRKFIVERNLRFFEEGISAHKRRMAPFVHRRVVCLNGLLRQSDSTSQPAQNSDAPPISHIDSVMPTDVVVNADLPPKYDNLFPTDKY